MNLQTFYENFELLAEAPNGVQKLREMILQLAVQGKLVPQDPNDEPASVLLEKINQEKLRLAKKKIIKVEKPLAPMAIGEIPQPLPSGWEWSRLSIIGLINPRNLCDDNKVVSFVPMNLVPQVYSEPVRTQSRLWGEIKKGFTHFAEEDVVLAKITPCFQNGKAAVMRGLENGIGAGTTELLVFRPVGGLIYPDYVLLYLKSPIFVQNAIPRMTGTAGQKRVPNDYFAENLFPLPPLTEQKRIVAKVDEMMRLCDELEERQQRKRRARVRLNQSALDHMLSVSTPEEFSKHQQRICDSFDLLYDTPETIGKLRQSILQLAVQGKLVPQDAIDEPASVLLEHISKKRELLGISIKKIRGALHGIDNEPFTIPYNWLWSSLSNISSKITDGEHATPKRSRTGHYLLSARNIRDGRIDLSDVDFVPTEEFERIRRRCNPDKGDILLSCSGSVGRIAIADRDNTYVMVRSAALVKPFQDEINSEYLAYALRSPMAQNQILEKAKTSAQSNLFLGRIKEIIVPLPPLKEQKRIVVKVDQLMNLCDELEAKLTQAQAASKSLMASIVNHLFSTVQESENASAALSA